MNVPRLLQEPASVPSPFAPGRTRLRPSISGCNSMHPSLSKKSPNDRVFFPVLGYHRGPGLARPVRGPSSVRTALRAGSFDSALPSLSVARPGLRRSGPLPYLPRCPSCVVGAALAISSQHTTKETTTHILTQPKCTLFSPFETSFSGERREGQEKRGRGFKSETRTGFQPHDPVFQHHSPGVVPVEPAQERKKTVGQSSPDKNMPNKQRVCHLFCKNRSLLVKLQKQLSPESSPKGESCFYVLFWMVVN